MTAHNRESTRRCIFVATLISSKMGRTAPKR